MMRRLPFIFLASLQLCGARARTFNIHDDLLAFPQFEVIFADSFISEKDAQSLLDSHASSPVPTASDAPTSGDDNDSQGVEYEVVKMSPHRYLCSMPVIEASRPENQTTELSKAEEARELSRAAAHGWDLVHQLEDSCLYFMSGWWSYSFCHNREIVQFHALPSMPDGQPPRRDPHTAEYVLGRAPTIEAQARKQVPASLQTKGDQRYLVQRLEGGTICDLTGRERTVEVQYHCSPTSPEDRIGYIKEVTICSYVMVINTPRLCDDVTFLPPRETKANAITCRLIDDAGDGTSAFTPPLLDEAGKQADVVEKTTVGGVEIGGRRVISAADQDGQPPVRLAPPRGYLNYHQTPQDGLIEVIVRAASKEDGGKVDALSREELERLDLKPEVIEEMRERMRKLAGDNGWQLEIVELPGEDDLRELRGWVHEEEEEEKEEKGKRKMEKVFKEEL